MPQLTPVFGLKLCQALSSPLVVQTHATQLAPKACKGTYVPSVRETWAPPEGRPAH